MLLILEVLLTLWLCKRLNDAGKNWLWGLVPLAALIAIGLSWGFFLGLLGATATPSSFVWVDIVGLGVIGWLIYNTK